MGSQSPNILADRLLSCLHYNPKGEAYIHGERHVAWKDFVPRIFKIARGLIRLGIKKNDKVALLFHNCPEFLEINYGIQVAGAIPVPINYRFTPREIEFEVGHCDAKTFLYDATWGKSVIPTLKELKNLQKVIVKGEDRPPNALGYEAFLRPETANDPAIANRWEDVAVIIYTGGTTGFPKGVMLTYQAHREMFANLAAHFLQRILTLETTPKRHQALIESLPIPASSIMGPLFRTRMMKKLLNLSATTRLFRKQAYRYFSKPRIAARNYRSTTRAMYPSLPFFHDAAYSNLMLGAFTGNITHVLPSTSHMDPESVFRIIEGEQVRSLFNVPTGWKQLLTFPEIKNFNRDSVQLAWTCGAPCPPALKKSILLNFPQAIVIDAFGQTEMTPLTSFRIDANPDKIKDHSIGKPIVDYKVVGEDQNEVPAGIIGEILYRSTTMMKGYYKDHKKTHDSLSEGWLKSGDLGFRDPEGEIHIVDRKNECINSGGEKIFPSEVEQILKTHPKIQEACIIGIPDEHWGQKVGAVVVPQTGQSLEPQEIIDFCRQKLAGFKIPRKIIIAKRLPFSPAGKLQRQKVREIYGRPSSP